MKNVKYVKNTKFIVRKLKSESDTEDAETILSMMYGWTLKKNKPPRMRCYVLKDAICFEKKFEDCQQWMKHKQKYVETRAIYNADKEAIRKDPEKLYLSLDMQKVILLPCLLGFKVNLCAKHLVV